MSGSFSRSAAFINSVYMEPVNSFLCCHGPAAGRGGPAGSNEDGGMERERERERDRKRRDDRHKGGEVAA